MKIGVVFPSVIYREGTSGVTRLMQGIEAIGFDELDMFDHVLMGYPTDTRRAPFYPPQMPIMEALMTLSYAAAITSTIGLGTGVLVLPQRKPALVAKQVSTLDTLSGGRVRLGVGVGWQRSEYEALDEDFASRGQRMDEAIGLLRAYFSAEHVNFQGEFYQAHEIAMEPKPPQGAALPIWIGGTKRAALRRCGELGDGWMGMSAAGDPPLAESIKQIAEFADNAGRDPANIGLQMSLSPGAIDKAKRKRFYADTDLMLERLVELKELGFGHVSIDCVPLFQLGHRSSEALLEQLRLIYEHLQPEL